MDAKESVKDEFLNDTVLEQKGTKIMNEIRKHHKVLNSNIVTQHFLKKSETQI